MHLVSSIFLFFDISYQCVARIRDPGCRCMARSSSSESATDPPSAKEESNTVPKTVSKEEKEEKEESRRHRRRRRSERSHERGRRRDRKSPSTRPKESRRDTRSAVPEPALPPRAKTEEQGQKPGKDKNKGSGKRRESWVCLECGQKVAPYKAAMEQHKHLNENCIACQQWNRLPTWEQNLSSSWQRCKNEARGIKYGRQTELAEDGYSVPNEDDRDPSPAWSLRSAASARQRDRSAEMWDQTHESVEKSSKRDEFEKPQEKRKKDMKEKRSNSPEQEKQKRRKDDRGSSEPEDDRRSSGKLLGKNRVVINIH